MASTETKAAEPATTTDQLARVQARVQQLQQRQRELGAQAAELRQQRDEATLASADDAAKASEASEASRQLGEVETQVEGVAGALRMAQDEVRELTDQLTRERAAETWREARRTLAKRSTRLHRARDHLVKAAAAMHEAAELGGRADRQLREATALHPRKTVPNAGNGPLSASAVGVAAMVTLAKHGFHQIVAWNGSVRREDDDQFEALDRAAHKHLEREAQFLPEPARREVEAEREPEPAE